MLESIDYTVFLSFSLQALLPSRTRDILVELAERCVVGIVSG